MHKHFFRSALLVLLLATNALADATNTALVPVFRKKPGFWLKRHQGFVDEKTNQIDLLFLGDSITDFWRDRGSNVWHQYYEPRHAANFGLRGDCTGHVLWRIENGELDGISPKVVVPLIGTNNNGSDKTNSPPRNTPAETVAGVTKVVQKVREKLPKSKILLLAIFPREDDYSAPPGNIKETNVGLAKLDDGKNVKFLDLTAKFLGPDGKLLDGVMQDKLHPAEKGYQIWAEAMEPTLVQILK